MRWYVDCDINELEGSVPYGIRVGKRLGESGEEKRKREKRWSTNPFLEKGLLILIWDGSMIARR